MQLGPVLSSLRQHKLTALLLMLQTAFSCAIVTNAMPMIVDRIERISMPSGVDDERLSLIAVADIQQGGNHQVQHASDLAALRRIAGVESAVALGQGLPFSGGEHSYGVCGSAEALRKASDRAIFEGATA